MDKPVGVKRYQCMYSDYGMLEDEDGNWIKYLEHERQLRIAREALEKIQNAFGEPYAEDDVTTTAREALAALGEE